MLCVNNEKVVSSGKYGGADILPGMHELLWPGLAIAFVLSLFGGGFLLFR